MKLSRTVAGTTAVAAAVSVGAGLWAMTDPRGFFAAVAPFPPYNQHLTHDIGAFQIGLGACLACGLLARDALLAVLAGNALGADAHFVSHVMDRHLGGHASDPLTIGAVGLVLTLLALARVRACARPGLPAARLAARGQAQ